MMKKNILLLSLGISAALVNGLWAQNSQIDLPDLTTVVTSDQTDSENIGAPDFSDIVVLPESSGSLVPELPDVEVSEKNDVVLSDDKASNKMVYAEGRFGVGYPSAFIGDFAVSRIIGNNPFKLAFSHDSEAGYAKKSLSAGYNHKITSVLLDKTFTWDKVRLDISGSYEDIGNGLQQQVEGISAENQDTISLDSNINFTLPLGFSTGLGLGGNYYSRYADISSSVSCAEWIARSFVLEMNPSAYVRWGNDNIHVNLEGGYWLEDDIKKTLVAGKSYTNRGQIGLDADWTINKIKLFGSFGAAFGDNFNTASCVLPFSLGLETTFPVYFSDRNTGIRLEGGLDSYMNTNASLEKKYKFSALDLLPSETSDWFVSVNLLLPLKTEFTGGIDFNFKKTAFGNGTWEPVYKTAGFESGIYKYSQNEKTIVSSDLSLTYRHKIFAGTIKWHANWADCPALENNQTFLIDFSFQHPQVKWGVDLNSSFSLDGADKIPEVNFEGFVGISPEVKIVLSAEDILKLFDPAPRVYAGKYIADSGNVKLFIKFLF